MLLFGARQTYSQSLYTIQDLGVVDRDVIGVSINDSSQIAISLAPEDPVGGPQLNGGAMLLAGGSITSLGSIGGSLRANGINSSGVVVGAADASDSLSHSILFESGQLTDLGPIGLNGSAAHAINSVGEIVGEEFFAGTSQAFRRSSSGAVTNLGTLGGSHSYAYDISSAGIIVGGSQTSAEQNPLAFVYANGAMSSLGTLGGVESVAYSLNDSNQIVGFADTVGGQAHAAVFNMAQGPVDLAPTHDASVAYDINENGKIVGYIDDNNGAPRAALFSLSNSPTLLQNLIPSNSGWTFLYEATAINNRGQIVGLGIFDNQPGFRAFLMTPVPEPSSASLLVLPGVILAINVRRRSERSEKGSVNSRHL